MFRFRFQALLAIRRREELIRQGILARALVEEREASALRMALQDEGERARQDLAGAMRSAASAKSAGSLAAIVAHLCEIDARRERAGDRCARAERERATATAALEAAARPRRALERLEVHERARYDLARARADEAEFGDANARGAGWAVVAEGAARG